MAGRPRYTLLLIGADHAAESDKRISNPNNHFINQIKIIFLR